MAAGFLAVFSETGEQVTLEEFQDWYNNEHVPLRLNHLRSFLSGARYSAVDGKRPGWLAMYEIDDVASFQDGSYTVLREKRSDRERELIARLGVLDRRTSEVVFDTGEVLEKSTGMKPGKPSGFVVTFGVASQLNKEDLGERAARAFAGFDSGVWVRTRVVRVFDSAVTGVDEHLKKVDVPEYLGVAEFTAPLDIPAFEREITGRLRDLAPGTAHLRDFRQWGLYRAYPCVAQGNLPT